MSITWVHQRYPVNGDATFAWKFPYCTITSTHLTGDRANHTIARQASPTTTTTVPRLPPPRASSTSRTLSTAAGWSLHQLAPTAVFAPSSLVRFLC
ncbi:uncharacterized protein CANTADRAFT_302578 [Suhomyces tanzawaensis NRRL Y-17324]|uniref:Uncharacterized protein n=1 Tax=Suhomyces tanzawaensis NRRL Y-17324 TaxID=984487 RepID=A0A1E4SCL2_9ASCO|nr:uncharacterized protein CANTADRAFT_302578 [Suhomyces tanzawaensis NRRL Y-17324]ODV77254.1 hypothetical protein CANTADRAFT_302578 [Suhomyces tanzawaensis NRRL Y-17324]